MVVFDLIHKNFLYIWCFHPLTIGLHFPCSSGLLGWVVVVTSSFSGGIIGVIAHLNLPLRTNPAKEMVNGSDSRSKNPN
jgi:hypothetical protein